MFALQLARYLNRSYWEEKQDGREPALTSSSSTLSSQNSEQIYNKGGEPVRFLIIFLDYDIVIVICYIVSCSFIVTL